MGQMFLKVGQMLKFLRGALMLNCKEVINKCSEVLFT